MRGLLLLVCAVALSACHHRSATVDPYSLRDLSELKASRHRTKQAISPIREQALRDAALSLSARSGLAARNRQIQKRLKLRERQLDDIFDFDHLMLSDRIVPPVLEEGRFDFNQPRPDVLRLSDRSYRIVQQAFFASRPPNWRQYLWQDFSPPELPNAVLLPKNKAERALWRSLMKSGWVQGAQMADQMFQANLARLKRDMQGMILYRTLLAQGMVTPPHVARSRLGVTGDDDEMRVNDQILRITALPRMKPHASAYWKAVAHEKGRSRGSEP